MKSSLCYKFGQREAFYPDEIVRTKTAKDWAALLFLRRLERAHMTHYFPKSLTIANFRGFLLPFISILNAQQCDFDYSMTNKKAVFQVTFSAFSIEVERCNVILLVQA
ncbi:hypothetical protein NMG60_11035177 [Bertholletia excelsa]